MSRSIQHAMLRAIELLGSEWRLAAAIGYAQNSVWRAKTIGRCSARMAAAIEAATDGKVKRRELCPACYGPARKRTPAEIRAAAS